MMNVSDKVLEKIKAHSLFPMVFFFWKSNRLWDNVENYVGTRQATDDNTIWRKRVVCRINEATDAHSEYVILIAFPGNNG